MSHVRRLLASGWLSAAMVFASSQWIEPGRLPEGVTGRGYAAGPLTLVGGFDCSRRAADMRVVGGELPEGVTLSAAGYLRGTPTQPGPHRFIVRAAGDCGAVQQEFAIDVTGAPILDVEPKAIEISYPQGTPPPGDPLVVQVRSSIGGMAYTLDGGSDWLRAIPARGVTPVAGAPMSADPLELHVDPSRLPPGDYRVVLRLSSWRAANSPVVPVTLRVLPPSGAAPGPLPGGGPFSGGGFAAPHDLDPPHQPAAPLMPGHGGDPHLVPSEHGPARTAPKAAAPPPAPKRLSRSGSVRKFAASKPPATKAAPPKPAAAAHGSGHAAPAASQGKPSPSGPAVEHAKNDAGAHGGKSGGHAAKPSGDHGAKSDGHGAKQGDHGAKPPAGGHSAKPADGHGAKSGDGHAAKPAAGHGAKPAGDHGAKPAADHGKPAAKDSHGAPAEAGHSKPSAVKHEKH